MVKRLIHVFSKTFVTAVLLYGVLVCPSGSADEPRVRIWVEPSFTIPSNDSFRDFYGDAFEGSLRFEYGMSRRIWTGLRSGFSTNESEHLNDLRFRDYFIGAISRYDLTPQWQEGSVLAGVGVQIDYRKVLLTADNPSADPDSPSDTTLVQSGTDLSLLLDCAVTYRLSARLLMAIQVNYNYFPLGNPDRGDFGNTGGLAVGGSLGIAF